ncbi:ABC transporter substrate-binding protein [Candidatus Omnitrophota bacterium]
MNCLKREVYLFFIACSFVVFLSVSLAGCSSQVKEAANDDSLTVWHWMSDRESALLELAERYKDETGTNINFELYAPSDAYTQKIRAAAQTSTLPDVFGLLAEKRDFASFINAGHIYNLTEHMNTDSDSGAWKDRFFKKALAVNEFKENNSFRVESGIYGVPIDVMNIQMLYNKDLLKEAGLDPENPPRNWNEFLEANRLLRDKGIQGLVSGWGEIWMIYCLASNYAFNIMGEDKVLDTVRGKVPYTDPDWVKVFDLFRQMRDEGLLASGIVTMVNKTAEQLFANSKAAFAFNGSWCVNVYNGMNPDLDYGAMLPPKASDNYPMMIWGGAGSSFMVNKKSANTEKAIEFLKWLTDREQQTFLLQKTKNAPSNKYSLEGMPEILSQFVDDMDNTTHPNVWGIEEFPVVIETFNKGIQFIIIGEKTPEGLAQEVQDIKVRELRRWHERWGK